MASITAWIVILVSVISVAEPLKNGNEDWGYVEVRPGANMFWWLYETTAVKSTEAATTRPLVIWLQGGPGASSTGYGNFEEIGPLDVNLRPRNTTWVNYVNLLFLDNPVGTGYSYVTSSSMLTTNNAQIGQDLVSFMKTFLREHPEWQDVPLYIFSESYGGKMAAEFGLGLYKAKQSGAFNVNIKGVALGDSWISPIDSVMTWASFLLHTGVVDQNGYEAIASSAQSTKQAVESGQWETATNLWGSTENEVLYVTDGIDFYNILYKIRSGFRDEERAHEPKTTEEFKKLLFNRHVKLNGNDLLDDLMNGQIRQKLGIIPSNVYWGGQSSQVFSALYEDFMRPVTSTVETLLDETDLDVTVFSGQLDLIVDTPGTVSWVDRLQWSGSNKWKYAKRNPLVANGYIEGYTKKSNGLNLFWILRAGHMVPADNPNGAKELLRQVTNFA